MTALVSQLRQFPVKAALSNAGLPIALVAILAMLVVPLPSVALDILFTFNIMAGLIVVMICINITRPLDFSAFPIVLLLTTMLRLSLNVASTRVVLVRGHEGPDAAGAVIEAFGEFVIGGNYVVGFIIFIILMIINFVVVTKGAGRTSEVIARFTLDALPGKQMAIDADLNAGVIDQETAMNRRAEVAQESDFFGSMDGASKFVRGDAIAGILILFINIFGGLVVGTAQNGLSLEAATEIYVLLTIGDGLVAQIPALLLSLSTAIVVTRVTTTESVGEQAKSQLSQKIPLLVSGSILTGLGLIPGMPHLVFLTAGLALLLVGYFQKPSHHSTSKQNIQHRDENIEVEDAEEVQWSDIEPIDPIGLELGYGLIPLVDGEDGGTLLTRIKGIRKKISTELGFLVQPIRIRDNLELDPFSYQITVKGSVRGAGLVKIGKDLAINSGEASLDLGEPSVKEPAFGLEAYWIEPSMADMARTAGYTVVDTSTVIATHVNSILKSNANELLGHDEVQEIIDRVAEKSPKLIEELVPNKLSATVIMQVLKNLLTETIPIRDLGTIFDALLTESARTQSADDLTEAIRPRISRQILQSLVNHSERLDVLTLDPSLEQMIGSALAKASEPGQIMLDPTVLENMLSSISSAKEEIENQGKPAILITAPKIRPWLSRVVSMRMQNFTVLSYTEIPEDQDIAVVSKISTTPNDTGVET